MKVSRLYIILAGFASGIFLRSFFILDWSEVIFVTLISVGLLIVYKIYKEGSRRWLVAALGIFLLGFNIGVVRMDVAEEVWSQTTLPPKTNSFEGVIVREPDQRQNNTQLYVENEDRLVLVFADRYSYAKYGDRVSIVGVATSPELFTTDLGREFNYPDYLKSKGVSYIVCRPESIEVISSGHRYFVVRHLLMVKEWFLINLSEVLPAPAYGLGAGILLGEQQALGADLLDVFRNAGVIHIIVLSGYNIMLVVGFVLFALSYGISRRYRMWTAIIFITAFALMVGLSATVLRASIMGTLFVTAYSLGRQYAVLRALIIAGAIMLLINPYLLVFDIGFQLSFMATVGLIFSLPAISSLKGSFLRRGFWGLIYTTVATQIAVLPLLIYHIGQVSLVAVFANVLVIPAVPLAMLTTFIAGILASMSITLGSTASYFAYIFLQYIIFVAEFMAALPFSTSLLPPLPGYGVFVMYILIFAATVVFRKIRQLSKRRNIAMSDWKIVEEKNTTDKVSAVSSDTPVFFR